MTETRSLRQDNLRIKPNSLGIFIVICTWFFYSFAIWTSNKYAYAIVWRTGTFRTIMVYLFNFACILALASHTRGLFSDPGRLIGQDAPTEFKAIPKTCVPCGKVWKPPRAHHCRICQECIFRMDHHCFWLNNCVGAMNQKYFILFLLYTAISSTLGIIFCLVAAVMWFFDPIPKVSAWGVLFSLATVAAGVIFLQHSLQIFMEQMEAIETNCSLVEDLQGTVGAQTGVMSQACEVFGRNWWMWWLPTNPNLSPNLCELVYDVGEVDEDDGWNSYEEKGGMNFHSSLGPVVGSKTVNETLYNTTRGRNSRITEFS